MLVAHCFFRLALGELKALIVWIGGVQDLFVGQVWNVEPWQRRGEAEVSASVLALQDWNGDSHSMQQIRAPQLVARASCDGVPEAADSIQRPAGEEGEVADVCLGGDVGAPVSCPAVLVALVVWVVASDQHAGFVGLKESSSARFSEGQEFDKDSHPQPSAEHQRQAPDRHPLQSTA